MYSCFNVLPANVNGATGSNFSPQQKVFVRKHKHNTVTVEGKTKEASIPTIVIDQDIQSVP